MKVYSQLMRLFNTLPFSVRNSTKVTIEKFKTRLDEYLRSISDEPLDYAIYFRTVV